ncbi:MAG: damage-inducible protein CinA [Stappia sp.]|uniref:CinA family protein n=1 Tax=Stappia sp. TaxID=1870903 RepID=UPI000C5FDADB|nr:CinA family protein [Stappia sp.]MAA97579.1 damage-inducible protein CinA [Stappia sp.]MBM22569.1 damage-inducible protein CinA [Stappia sp.]
MTDLAPLFDPAARVIERASGFGLKIATAESCTGGLIAALLTDVPGSSAVVDRGFVTYSNEAKTEMIGVPAELIEAHGAVSREVALAMVEGALAASRADLAVAVTGVAGPGGGSREKPVGLVHFGFARRGGEVHHLEERFDPELGRSGIRLATVAIAFAGLSNLMDR